MDAGARARVPRRLVATAGAITRYDDVLAIEKDPARSPTPTAPRPAAFGVPMMISMDDPEHRRRRKLVSKGFTPKRVRDKAEDLVEICDALIDEVAERGECDFVWDVAAPLPLLADRRHARLRARADRRPARVVRRPDRGARPADPARPRDGPWRPASAFLSLPARGHRRPPLEPGGDDLVSSMLVHAEIDGDRLDERVDRAGALLILIGGDETTRHVITGGMLALLDHPDQRDASPADPALLRPAVEEMLRWVSPIKNMAAHRRCPTSSSRGSSSTRATR